MPELQLVLFSVSLYCACWLSLLGHFSYSGIMSTLLVRGFLFLCGDSVTLWPSTASYTIYKLFCMCSHFGTHTLTIHTQHIRGKKGRKPVKELYPWQCCHSKVDKHKQSVFGFNAHTEFRGKKNNLTPRDAY